MYSWSEESFRLDQSQQTFSFLKQQFLWKKSAYIKIRQTLNRNKDPVKALDYVGTVTTGNLF